MNCCHHVFLEENWKPVELKGSSTYPGPGCPDPDIQGVSRLVGSTTCSTSNASRWMPVPPSLGTHRHMSTPHAWNRTELRFRSFCSHRSQFKDGRCCEPGWKVRKEGSLLCTGNTWKPFRMALVTSLWLACLEMLLPALARRSCKPLCLSPVAHATLIELCDEDPKKELSWTSLDPSNNLTDTDLSPQGDRCVPLTQDILVYCPDWPNCDCSTLKGMQRNHATSFSNGNKPPFYHAIMSETWDSA